jgi:hypothetical protein
VAGGLSDGRGTIAPDGLAARRAGHLPPEHRTHGRRRGWTALLGWAPLGHPPAARPDLLAAGRRRSGRAGGVCRRRR